MVKRKETLEILGKERNYEDEIMNNLTNFFISALDDIKNISEDERATLNKKLRQIRDESAGHKQTFEELIKFVEQDGADNY